MRNPILVLNALSKESSKENYKLERLYRNLYNPEFFYLAYEKLSKNNGALTQGVDENTIDNMSIQRIEKIIESLRDYSYQPQPTKRVYIEKKGNSNKKRPLGLPSFDDKLVQEVIRMILESIYEPNFSDKSHGFRPNRSCHTALNQISMWNGINWFIEGDIKSYFDTIDHKILIEILEERINDNHFLILIKKFLKAGYMEDWVFHNSYSGTPQGGILSPILSNIYLDKFDKYIEKYIEDFNIGKNRKRNPEYKKFDFQIKKRQNYLEKGYYVSDKNHYEKYPVTEEDKKRIIKEIKNLKKERLKYSSKDPMDENFKRMVYIRYADDFMVGIIGSKEDALKIKQDIYNFMKKTLKLELSIEKTLITHSGDFARFLGYNITYSKVQTPKKRKSGAVCRDLAKAPSLYVPKEKWQGKLREYKALKINLIDGKEVFEPIARSGLINNDDLEIINRYNAEIRGLYNYYRLAHNVNVLQKFHYVMKFSFFKTLAGKYRTSMSKIITKYSSNRDIVVKYKNSKGLIVETKFYNEGFKRNPYINKEDTEQNVDKLDTFFQTTATKYTRNGLIKRLKAQECEMCGNTNVKLQMHHIKKLKDVKGKTSIERMMIARKRKTIALCFDCHLNGRHEGDFKN